MSPIQSLVKDIEAALDDQTSDRRVALLHRITNLFIEQMPDLNANDVEAAMKIIEGTARQMGITVSA